MIDRKTVLQVEGELVPGGKRLDSFPGVSIDSRSIGSGEIFIPLEGENTDGHCFIQEAFEKGAGGSFVARGYFNENREALLKAQKEGGGDFIIVPEPLKALQDLARVHLRENAREVKRIGITGSNGKTTTKELIGGMLSGWADCYVSRGNYNSEIGLCIEALRVKGTETFAVFEMGMNRKNEIPLLADIVRPDYAVITNIGTAHIGLLGSREAIAVEKKQIFSRFDGGQIGFVYEKEPFYNLLAEGVNGRILLYGSGVLNDIEGEESLGLKGSRIICRQGAIRFPLVGEYNRRNLYAAMALGKEIGVSFNTMKESFEKARPLFGRGEIIYGDVTLILDYYNANYESITESIRFLESTPVSGRKIAVLGDMKELENYSEEYHKKLGTFLTKGQLDIVIFYGESMEYAYNEYRSNGGTAETEWTEDIDKLAELLEKHAGPGDTVLMKGSRSLEMEKVHEKVPVTGKECKTW